MSSEGMRKFCTYKTNSECNKVRIKKNQKDASEVKIKGHKEHQV